MVEGRAAENGHRSTPGIDSSPQPSTVPLPPWELEGSAIVFLNNWRSVLALVSYDSSPVGPYEELAVATLTFRGPTVTEMVVNSPASMVGGRRGWGFPKVLGQLRWEQAEQQIVFHTDKRKYRVKKTMLVLPVKLNAWCWQMLDGQRVRVPLQMCGKVRIGWQGRRIAVVVESLALRVLRPEL